MTHPSYPTRCNIDDINYENKLLESVNNESEIHTESGIDYWIFTKNTYKKRGSFEPLPFLPILRSIFYTTIDSLSWLFQ